MEPLNKTSISERASTQGDWEGYYSARGDGGGYTPIDYSDFRNMPFMLVFEKIKEYFCGGDVLEIGAGDSDVLVEVCKNLNPSLCVGLDYVEAACDRLNKKANSADADIKTVCADMFTPPSDMLGRFDFVMSHGVAEHFYDLTAVLKAKAAFAKEGGIVFTLIPSHKRTIYGALMKKWNKSVYDAHVMYDLEDLLEANKNAGLEVIWGDYLCSSNFGMLSWCFKDNEKGVSFWVYKQLSRLSKLVWFYESKFGLLKPTRAFSPTIITVARVCR